MLEIITNLELTIISPKACKVFAQPFSSLSMDEGCPGTGLSVRGKFWTNIVQQSTMHIQGQIRCSNEGVPFEVQTSNVSVRTFKHNPYVNYYIAVRDR